MRRKSKPLYAAHATQVTWSVSRNHKAISGMSVKLTRNAALKVLYMRRIVINTEITSSTMPKHPTKTDRLRELGALNPRPQQVRAAWFDSAGFFDANDLVQVKYEMLRHARQDGVTKAEAASLFGLSRPTFYLAEASYARDGISGLLPQPRAPKSAHKLTPEVMTIIDEHHRGTGPIQARTLAQLVHEQLGLSVHPRSIERAIARKKKR
jgi:transposase